MPMKPRTRQSLALCTLLALGSSLANAPLPKAWANWQYSRAVELPQTDSPRLASFVLPDDVFEHSRIGLPDLRIIDDSGNETAYALRIHNGSTNTVPLQTKLVENSFVPGQFTQLVLNLGSNPAFHNAVEIQSAATDFIAWVSVEASDDARAWRIVEPRAPFFKFASEYHGGMRVISYSENNARYLRIHILDGSKQFPVFGAVVFHQAETAAERAPFDAAFSPGAPSGPHRSAWVTDLGSPGAPISEATLEAVRPAEFIRTVAILESDDGKEWNPFAEGEIYRYKIGETSHQQLNVSMPFAVTQGRYWKIEVENGNDAPLEGLKIQLYTRPRHLYFEQQPGRSYRLLYSQTRASAPQYDLTRRLSARQEKAAVAAQVGPEESNSAYADPRPWTEKNRYLLWVAVAIAALLLGYSAANSLRRIPPAPQDP
jgi:hypothetical protein